MTRSAVRFAAVMFCGLLLPAASVGEVRDGSSGPSFAVPDAEASPEQVVAALEDALIIAMRAGDSLDVATRRERLHPVVERALDVGRMARLLFGRDFRRLSPEERDAFEAAFLGLSVANYAHHFIDHDGQYFERVDSSVDDDRRAVVRSHFVRREGEPITFEYILANGAEGWQVVNVITDGVSDLALRRARFTEAFADGGMEAVIDYIGRQIDLLAQD